MQGCCILHAACNGLTMLRQEGEWVASEGTYDPGTGTLTVLHPCFRSASKILENDWHGWNVKPSNRGGLLQWGSMLMQCQSRWDEHQLGDGL